MTADLADALVPLAAELVGTVRDFGPDDVAAVLARVPDGRHDALAVVLAAMVDPDATPADLLAWISGGPVQSRDFLPSTHIGTKRGTTVCDRCGKPMRESSLRRHINNQHRAETVADFVDRVAS